ncbi:MAG: DUF2628 domain-containing protein [Aestuariivirga sp.]|jgi:Protein of unknown function (DUF2628)|uniref:DUF2628 domain-containing protein n=1 Tax=Aestuariivirga sp. TaxID=2650926 RepID=UPI003015F7B0
MKLFTVLESPDGKAERVAFVPEGFSWSALILNGLWALWHRMWVVAALLFALSSALTVATNLELLGSGLAALLNFGIALVFGFEARSLQVKSLERVGFRRTGLIQASNSEAAELVYFAGRAPVATKVATSQLRAAHDDTLGIFGNV